LFIKEIGDNATMNLLISMGENIKIFKNDDKLIAASEFDPSTNQSISRINTRERVGLVRGETDIYGRPSSG
jgi:hypothetical protein